MPESRHIDYKQQLPGTRDLDHREFLADVSSFGNTGGGLMFYGLKEEEGRPTEVVGLHGVDPEAEILRLEAMARDCISPRLPGITMRSIEVQKNHIVLVRIPQSWVSPHMVTHKGTSRFFARNSAGKYQLDVSELRTAFVRSAALPERLESLRTERVSKIVSGETPVPLHEGQRVVLHLVPFSSLSPEASIDIRSIDESHDGFVALASEHHGNRFNFDGRIVAHFPNKAGDRTHSYLQVFRSGILESVSATLIQEDPNPERGNAIQSLYVEPRLIDFTLRYLHMIDSLGLDFTVAVMLSLTGVKGFRISPDPGRVWYSDRYPIDRNILLLPRVVFESVNDDVPTVLRPALDAMWNAAGWPGSMNYDESGAYPRV